MRERGERWVETLITNRQEHMRNTTGEASQTRQTQLGCNEIPRNERRQALNCFVVTSDSGNGEEE